MRKFWLLLLAVCCLTAGNLRGDSVPKAPAGTRVRVVATLDAKDQEPVRLAAHPSTGEIYVLGGGGDVTRIDPASGVKRRVLTGADYIDRPARQETNIPLPVDARWVNSPLTLRSTLCLGLAFDSDCRLYVVANVQVPGKIFVNRVDIYRSAPIGEHGLEIRAAEVQAAPHSGADGLEIRPAKGARAVPRLWTTFSYPYGVGGFNHGACRIAQGPDGMIYLGSGSRTDHGERGEVASISTLGEAPHPEVPGGPGFAGGDFTASIVRFDRTQGQQTPEVFTRGNRNPFGFDWDDSGRLVAAEHGPMADHPEELNHIQQGKHYGFPYEFGNHERPAYADAVPAPQGWTFEPPIRNLGPAGLLGEAPLYSFAPHAAPGGMVFYRRGTLPKRYDGSFFLARFGNLLNYNRIGFDVLNIRLARQGDELVAHCERFLDRLGRPIDLCVSQGKLYVLEYCQQSETAGPGSEGFTQPGRVLEVAGS